MTYIKVHINQKIISRKVSGVLHTERYIELVRELSVAAELHRGYDIVVDLRDTVTAPEMIDLMAIVSAWSRLMANFVNRIAAIIPKIQDLHGCPIVQSQPVFRLGISNGMAIRAIAYQASPRLATKCLMVLQLTP